jgi:hypothetical protein
VRAERRQHPPELLARPIVPDRGHQVTARPHGNDILRDVRCPAQGVLALTYAHHGHRGLGGDAIDVAAEIHVEHRIAHDHDALALRGVQERRDPLVR